MRSRCRHVSRIDILPKCGLPATQRGVFGIDEGGVCWTHCRADVHRASSIQVTEAAKVIENTYRDLNIALTNELAQIFALMGIPVADVLAAAATKWNFARYEPGLAGGHCIGVDQYYPTFAAQRLGHNPKVILAGRRMNDGMAEYVVQRVIRMIMCHCRAEDRTVLVLGMTFKPDVPDIRNSKVKEIIRRLLGYGLIVNAFDPMLGADAPDWGQYTTYRSLDEIPAHSIVLLLVPHTRPSSKTGLSFFVFAHQVAKAFSLISRVSHRNLRRPVRV
ncbi:MAG: UDP binding domain-containing protein [bacterium]